MECWEGAPITPLLQYSSIISFIVPVISIKTTGIPKYFGPDIINYTNRDPEVFRERKFRSSKLAISHISTDTRSVVDKR
ncbi:MAG TPA: hypothetical protein ENH12_05405 [Proteobacteria bacterium]|nr:hypothetical protein [Pseudomonadota bacterium]